MFLKIKSVIGITVAARKLEMKRTLAAVTIGLGISSLTIATSLPAFYGECRVLDRVFEATRPSSATRYAALQILESVASGHVVNISPEIEAEIGVRDDELHRVEFTNSVVRAYALRRIGASALPDALAYLQGLTRANLGDDFNLWLAAQIALLDAQSARISDPAAKVQFLEAIARQNRMAASWAVDELCDIGSYSSLPVIRESVLFRNPTPRGNQEVAFCEARIGVISTSPDRVKALGSVLTTNNNTTRDPSLTGWAIRQLASMRSVTADNELQRYFNEIARLPSGSPERQELTRWQEEIKMLLGERPK